MLISKQIDSSNYKTAYASGMKEDVSSYWESLVPRLMEQMNFQGNQLNYLDTLFRIGYAIFLIVSLIFPALLPGF